MMSESTAEDPRIILFQGRPGLQPGEVRLHKISDAVFGKALDDVKKDWEKVVAQIKEMVQGTEDRTPKGYQLDTIEISLGFSAQGRLVFIAEAGIEASLTITFKRAQESYGTTAV